MPILDDVLHPTRTHLRAFDVKEAGPPRDEQHVAVRLENPLTVHQNDIVRLSKPRHHPPHELARVTFAGSVFTWLRRGWGGTATDTRWKRGDWVDVIAVARDE